MTARGWVVGIPMMAATLAAARPACSQEGTKVSGVVFDSLTMRKLRGATVQIADVVSKSWVRTVETDSTGSFEFGAVPPGTYLLGFFHPRLDSLGLEARMVRVDIRTDAPVHVTLATSSPRTVARTMCGAAARDSTGLVAGYVRSAESAVARENATLSVHWSEYVIENKSIHRQVHGAEAASGPTGRFVVCGIPLGTPVLLQASADADTSGFFEVTIPPGGLLHRDIYVGKRTHVMVASQDSSPPTEHIRGTARLDGRVIAANKRPIPSARVSVWATGLETTTDGDGVFHLAELPSGTHTLDVRAVGFTPIQQPVDIVDGVLGQMEVGLTSLGITLDTVRVTARVYTSRSLAEFERRKRSGLGRFIGEDEIEKMNPFYLTDLLRTVPSVRLRPASGGYMVMMRGDLGGDCVPDIFIDNVRMFSDANFPLDFLAPVRMVRAVEVYARQVQAPPMFSSMRGCGSIVIWTGARRRS